MVAVPCILRIRQTGRQMLFGCVLTSSMVSAARAIQKCIILPPENIHCIHGIARARCLALFWKNSNINECESATYNIYCTYLSQHAKRTTVAASSSVGYQSLAGVSIFFSILLYILKLYVYFIHLPTT